MEKEDVWQLRSGRRVVSTPELQRLGGTLISLDPDIRDERLGEEGYFDEFAERFALMPNRVLFLVADEIVQQYEDGYRTRRPRLGEIERMIRVALATLAELELARRRRKKMLPHRHASPTRCPRTNN